MNNYTIEKYISCCCGCTIMKLSHDVMDETLNISLFTFKKNSNRSLWSRVKYLFKYCKYIWKYNEPYDDEIILNKEQIKQLSLFLATINKNDARP